MAPFLTRSSEKNRVICLEKTSFSNPNVFPSSPRVKNIFNPNFSSFFLDMFSSFFEIGLLKASSNFSFQVLRLNYTPFLAKSQGLADGDKRRMIKDYIIG